MMGRNFSNQQLVGTIPPSIKSAAGNIVIDVSHTDFYGQIEDLIPTGSQFIYKLYVFVSLFLLYSINFSLRRLSNARFYGTLPPSFCSAYGFSELYVVFQFVLSLLMMSYSYRNLDGNYINGTLPDCGSSSLLTLTSLYFIFWSAHLSRGNLFEVFSFRSLSDNFLNGTIPNFYWNLPRSYWISQILYDMRWVFEPTVTLDM
jgi:hypothetical protein